MATTPSSSLQTVRGLVPAETIHRALAHEHLFVDFQPTDHPGYMDVDWGMVRGAAINRLRELRAQGVDLLVDWTTLGVGRNVALLRDVSGATGLHVVCPTGIYLAKRPPGWEELGVSDLAARFTAELTAGIDGTGVRAGFIKIATSDDGPTPDETTIHRAAAIAARETRAAIGLHSPLAGPLARVVETLAAERVPLDRLIWAHAQRSTPADHARFAADGIYVQFDSFSSRNGSDAGPPSLAERSLDAVGALIDAGHLSQILVSDDATVVCNPPTTQYGYDATSVMRVLKPALRERFGDRATRTILRDNVLAAFRWPEPLS
jgi:predicted metal-dependent phosphotriesterase family hydrolase